MWKMNTISFLIALFTVTLEPDMQVFFSKLHPCLRFLLAYACEHGRGNSGNLSYRCCDLAIVLIW